MTIAEEGRSCFLGHVWPYLLVFLSGSAVGLFGCGDAGMSDLRKLASVEIREYQGEKLSSILDFRENSIRGPQYVDIESYQLSITGLVREARQYTYQEVINDQQHYQKGLTLNCVEGWSVTILWEGVLVRDIIKKSGILPDASVIIFHADDGYTTSFPVDYIMNNDILMAYKMNEVLLPAERGYPFQLVAESKWGYKWVKWIIEIELSDNDNYRGYWESRGFSNRGDLDQQFSE